MRLSSHRIEAQEQRPNRLKTSSAPATRLDPLVERGRNSPFEAPGQGTTIPSSSPMPWQAPPATVAQTIPEAPPTSWQTPPATQLEQQTFWSAGQSIAQLSDIARLAATESQEYIVYSPIKPVEAADPDDIQAISRVRLGLGPGWAPEPTAMQQRVWPVLSKDRSVIVIDPQKHGSLNDVILAVARWCGGNAHAHLRVNRAGPRVLILAPSDQVADEIGHQLKSMAHKLCLSVLYGNETQLKERCKRSDNGSFHMVVGTPQAVREFTMPANPPEKPWRRPHPYNPPPVD